MEYIAIILSILALVGAGFAFIRANSSHHILGSKIEKLKDKNSFLEERLRKLEGASNRGNRPAREQQEPGRQKKQRAEQQQPEQRQKQRERPQPQPQQAEEVTIMHPQLATQEQQPRRKRENRRRNEPKGRNEPMQRNPEEETGSEPQMPAAAPIKLEVAGGDLLDELEQAAGSMPATAIPAAATPEAEPESRIQYAIIPEDGVIRMHQLQQRPDSDSYIEIDVPAAGNSSTHYRFNLAGNHAFVIAQGIDRLENAFDFEKPSNRMVTKVVQQQDGVLTKVNNGWKIMEKARIDFR